MNSSTNSTTPVILHVYDLTKHNRLMYPLGLGVFHTGVEVYGIEYAFGGHPEETSGIFRLRPGTTIPGIKLRTSLTMGETTRAWSEISQLLIEMSYDYTGRSYHIINRNCNHFSDDFVRRLCGRGIPSWINRMAAIGAMFPCVVVPDQLAPTLPPTPPNLYNNNTHNHDNDHVYKVNNEK